MTAREEILTRIRTALDIVPANPVASYAHLVKDYKRSGQLDRKAILELFLDRLVDYDAEVLEIDDESGIADAIAKTLRHANEASALVAPAFPHAWLPNDCHFHIDDDLAIAAIEDIPAVITTCEAAVASSGTIILVHEGAQARRILTLLPDHHICLVQRDQVFEVLPEAFAVVADKTMKPITTIAGPSATSDIEMIRVRGVHGPRSITVILYG